MPKAEDQLDRQQNPDLPPEIDHETKPAVELENQS